NDVYFLAKEDGYDASRILKEAFLEEMEENCKGELAVVVQQLDVLIFADIQNDGGYNMLQVMTVKYFAVDIITITTLSFIYENKQLESVFIIAKKKSDKK